MKYVYLVLAFLFLILGFIGVMLPGIPTTPLLLVASFFFAKGSTKFHTWFTHTKIYREHLESFVCNRCLKLRTKIFILSFSSVSMGISIYFISNLYVRIALGAVLAVQYVCFLFVIKTCPSYKVIPMADLHKNQH